MEGNLRILLIAIQIGCLFCMSRNRVGLSKRGTDAEKTCEKLK